MLREFGREVRPSAARSFMSSRVSALMRMLMRARLGRGDKHISVNIYLFRLLPSAILIPWPR